jgi:hypothetical protein
MYFVKLAKLLYGLKQLGRMWYNRLSVCIHHKIHYWILYNLSLCG